MQIDIIDTYAGFKKLKSNWDTIYESDSEAQFFLSWTWLSQVFSHHPTGWFIIAVKPDNPYAGYVAMFPLRMKTLMSKRFNELYNEVSVAGRYFWADYSGLICHPDYEEQAIPLLSSRVISMRWREMSLKNLYISDRRLALFLSSFNEKHYAHEFLERTGRSDGINRLVCPYVDLPTSFDTYLAEKLSANTRQKVRRYLRKVETSTNLKITHSAPETHERDLDILIGFWKKKWAARKGRDVKRLGDKYRDILQQGLRHNTIFLPVLWQDDKPLGALASFIDRQKQTLLYFVAGRKETHNNPPPGLVLHAHSIRWAIENGLEIYDFLRGNESFKYSYGAKDRQIRYLRTRTLTGTNHHRTLDPRCADEVLQRATKYQYSNRIEAAEISFQQLLEIRPNDTTALRRYARLRYQVKDYTGARKIYLRLIDVDENSVEGWRGLGKSLLSLNRLKSAETTLRKAIRLHPSEDLSTRFYLGQTLAQQHKHKQAAAEYSTILTLIPKDKWEKQKQQKARNYLKQYHQA